MLRTWARSLSSRVCLPYLRAFSVDDGPFIGGRACGPDGADEVSKPHGRGHLDAIHRLGNDSPGIVHEVGDLLLRGQRHLEVVVIVRASGRATHDPLTFCQSGRDSGAECAWRGAVDQVTRGEQEQAAAEMTRQRQQRQ